MAESQTMNYHPNQGCLLFCFLPEMSVTIERLSTGQLAAGRRDRGKLFSNDREQVSLDLGTDYV